MEKMCYIKANIITGGVKMDRNFVISGFSDEISAETAVQFEALKKLNIKYFEPRGINGENISVLSEEKFVNLKKEMDENQIKASSIGSPIGKIGINDDFTPHFEAFKNVVKGAKILGAKYIRIFSFFIPDNEDAETYRDEVISRLKKLIEYAKEQNVILLHENEKGIYGEKGKECLDLMETLFCKNFRAVFDPANFVQCGEDTKECFEMLAPYIEYMHIKDAVGEKVVPSGYGDGNVEYILTKLKERGFKGFLSLEPHLGSFEGLSDLELDDKMEKLPKGGEGTFTLAYNALTDILKRIGE